MDSRRPDRFAVFLVVFLAVPVAFAAVFVAFLVVFLAMRAATCKSEAYFGASTFLTTYSLVPHSPVALTVISVPASLIVASCVITPPPSSATS
jgi:hypothetical protein